MVETGHKFHDKVSRLVTWGHWFTFFNLLIVSLIALRYVKFAGLSDSGLGIAYQFTSLIGHFSFLSAVFYTLILFPLAFITPYQRLYRLLVCLISACAISVLLLDTQIFKLYHFHLNPLIWQFLQRPEQVELIYSVELHFITIPIIFVVEVLISYFVWKKCRYLQAKRIGRPIAIFLFVTFVLTHLVFIWADATQYRPITQDKSIYPLSYPMTARSFLKRQGWLNDDKLFKHINQQDNIEVKNLRYPLIPLTYENNAPTKNVLIITVDALRADMLNDDNMPFVSQLSKQGIIYENHFSGANNRPQGLFSLFYGLPNRYWFDITLNYIPPILMTRLTEENYQFGLFSSIGFLHPEFLQSSFSQIKTKELKRYSAINNNPTTTKKWETWIAQQNQSQKWFSYIHYDQENQLQPPKNGPISLAAKTKKLSLYQQQVLDIDKQIQEVISTLREKQLLENTIVLMTGTFAASFEKKATIDAALDNAHVPLIVLWPGEEARTVTRMTSHVDIVPTLMEKLLGTTTNPDQYSSGQSLFDDSARRYLLSGDLNKHVIYEKESITQFSNDGMIDSINWQGEVLNDEEPDITLLIDVLSKLRRFNDS